MSITGNSDAGFLSRVKSGAQTFSSRRRPWRDFFDLSSFNLPISLSDATTRISQNLTHFRVNYIIILLSILFLGLIYHPFSLIVFFLTLFAWFLFYFGRDEPLTLLGFTLDDRIVAAALFVLTLIALLLTRVWTNVLVSVCVGAVLVILHAALRSTDDLVMDDQESPYGVLLDDIDGGAYDGF